MMIAAKSNKTKYAAGTCHGGYKYITNPGMLSPRSAALIMRALRFSETRS
jgi:hypothetical protein